MDEQNIDETKPTPVGDETKATIPVEGETTPVAVVESDSPEPTPPQKKRRGRWILWGLLALVLLAAVVVISGMAGYESGIDLRENFESTQLALAVDEQYELGLQDMETGNYEAARQRFEYVIDLEPGYPGATDRLAEVLLIQNVTATPTLAPTPTVILPTPTPDLRGEEELYVQAQNFVADEMWDEAIEALETLRKKNPNYHAIDVDGMFFVALRNRGIKKISLGELEPGIYDLTLAEGFGFLDTEAVGWRTWARYYITGASFWDIDWGNAVYYFGQVAPMTPNMHDGSGWTAAQRYLEAVIEYAGVLENNKDWCAAYENYDLALDLGADRSLEEARDFAAEKCDEVDDGSGQPLPPDPDS